MKPTQRLSVAATVASGAVGGVLMGMANLVPGVSGGTMLLAVGIYPRCIEAMAKLTTLRLDREAAILLAAVSLSAGMAILMAAGTLRDLVLHHRWITYSLFLGATLGGVPLLWRMLGRLDAKALVAMVGGIAAMAITTLVQVASPAHSEPSSVALFLAGLGAFAAMLLPGLSGSYILVLSGQYVPILGAVDEVKEAVFAGSGLQWSALVPSATVLLPFAAGMLAALVGMSNLINVLLRRQRALLLGLLLGLVLGAVLGLWPFGSESAPYGIPSLERGAASLALVTVGFLFTWAVARNAPAAE